MQLRRYHHVAVDKLKPRLHEISCRHFALECIGTRLDQSAGGGWESKTGILFLGGRGGAAKRAMRFVGAMSAD